MLIRREYGIINVIILFDGEMPQMANTRSPLVSPPKRLLVVDDEAHVRTAIMRALTLRGHTVSGAASGEEALAMLETELYHLMVLDIKMPGIGGIEVMRQARKLQPDVLVVILTGRATLDSALAAVKSHAADYLLKPASMYDIANAISRALDGKSRRAAKTLLAQIADDPLSMPRPRPDNLRGDADSPPRRVERFAYYKMLMLDREHRLICLNGDAQITVALTEGEFAVLNTLFSRPAQTLTCRQLVRLSWGADADGQEAENVIRPYVSRLRKKLRTLNLGRQLIITVRDRGYAMRLQD